MKFQLLYTFIREPAAGEYPNQGAGVWVGAQVDPLAIFVGVVSELGWG